MTTAFGRIWHKLKTWTGRGEGAASLCLRRRRPMLRACVGATATCGALAIVALLAVGLLFMRLAQGPLILDGAAPRIAQALNERFGGAYGFAIDQVDLERDGAGLALTLRRLTIADADGRTLLSAPSAHMSFDPLALLWGQAAPRWLEVVGVDLHVSVKLDGALAIAAPDAASAKDANGPPLTAAATAAPSGPAAAEIFDHAGAALAHLLDSLSGPDSPLNAVERLGVARSRLVVTDQNAGTMIAFNDVDIALRRAAGAVEAQLVADGPNGRWRARAKISGAAGARRQLEMSISDLSFDEIALLAGLRQPGFFIDSPISAKMNLTLNEADQLVDAKATFLLGAGVFKPDNRDSEPILLDEIAGALRYDSGARLVALEKVSLDAGTTHFELAGDVAPPDAANDAWRVTLATRPGSVIGPERPNEQPIEIGAGQIRLRYQPANKALVLDTVELAGPELDLNLSGQIDAGDAPHLALVVGAKNMPAMNLLRLWPSDVASPVRAWFLQHLLGGQLDNFSAAMDFDSATLKHLANDEPAPEDSVHMSGKVSKVSIWFLPGLPPVTQVEGSGHLSGRKASFDVSHGALEVGAGRRMQVGETHFVIPDTGVKNPPAAITAHLSSSLDTLAELLAAESLKSFGGLPLDPAQTKGQVDGVLSVDLKLGRPASSEDTQVRVNASVSNFVAEKLIGKEKLDNATLNVTVDRSGLHAAGAGRMFGAPATLDIRKAPADVATAVIGLSLDESARKSHNLSFPGLSGIVLARLEAVLAPSGVTTAKVDLDLAKAEIDHSPLGVSKPLGKPGAASFQIAASPKGAAIDNIVADLGPVALRGSASLGPDGALVAAKLGQFRLASGDDMRVDLSRSGDGVKIVARGNAFDARPLLQALSHPPPDSVANKEPPPDLDLDLKAARVTGQNNQNLANADLRLVRKAGTLKQFQLAGTLGARPITGDLAGANAVNLQSDNAGALLAFLDLYKRMEGGAINLSAHFGEGGRTDGRVVIHEFALRDEPALRRLASEGSAPREDGNEANVTPFDPTRVAFTKLDAGFVRAGARLEVHDGVMYGPDIGTSLDGAVDFARNFVDVKGTFVPAYGLNNFFARIPLFGPILGGGAHEGLFAVNFRVSGPASGPTLSINPLSAIAPGFLRKIFGAGEIPSAFQAKGVTQ